MNLTAALPRSRAIPQSDDAWQRLSRSDTQLRRRIRARKRGCLRSRGWLQSRHAEPFLRRPQRPGARNAFTFGEPQQFVPRHCSRRPVWLAVYELFSPFTKLSDPPWQALRKTAAEPALRDHWQRDVHACSESTFADLETFHNRKSLSRCAKPVDDESCLWKLAENADEISEAGNKERIREDWI